VREACDVVVSIPIAAGTESLNASVAVGVALYEASRHRTRQGSSGLTSPGATPRTAASSGLSTSTPAT
jgi:tRNA C32,U32 (ribose-2'-O)-methylase TrmJ